MSRDAKPRQRATGGARNGDNSGRTSNSEYNRLIAEHQARDYSVTLTCGESGGEDEAKERTSLRFLLLRVMLADKEQTLATFKVAVYLLMIKYNDHTGQCNPGVDTIAKATALDPRSVRRALVSLRDTLAYLIYESTDGGHKTDTTNVYEFQFPPMTHQSGVTPSPKSTPDRRGNTTDQSVRGTPDSPVREPLTRRSAKQYLEQPSEPQYISNVPLAALADALPRQSAGSSDEKGRKEESKRASEGGTIARPLAQSEVIARLEAIKPYAIEGTTVYVEAVDENEKAFLERFAKPYLMLVRESHNILHQFESLKAWCPNRGGRA